MRCFDPPIPPNYTNLVYDYVNGTELELGGRVNYSCLPEYKFNHDFFLGHFDVECVNGTWNFSGPWLGCTHPTGEEKHPLIFSVHSRVYR